VPCVLYPSYCHSVGDLPPMASGAHIERVPVFIKRLVLHAAANKSKRSCLGGCLLRVLFCARVCDCCVSFIIKRLSLIGSKIAFHRFEIDDERAGVT